MRSAVAIAVAVIVVCRVACGVARADVDPKRKVIVLEYRSNSAALTGIATRVVGAISKQTSLDVLGQDQTRTIYGAHLDQVIVKCAGEAMCIARIGQKVGASEVLLVGISELGDVILTMQRIDVAGRSVTARIAESLAMSSTPSDDQLIGYLTRLLPPSDFLRFGVIDIVANVTGAAVTVEGKSRGLTPIPSLKLHAPATYDIRVEKQGFVPFTTRVKLPPDSAVKVEAQLSRRGGQAWYQHWYVLAGAAVLVAGAGGTAIYFATQQTSAPGDGSLHGVGIVK